MMGSRWFKRQPQEQPMASLAGSTTWRRMTRRYTRTHGGCYSQRCTQTRCVILHKQERNVGEDWEPLPRVTAAGTVLGRRANCARTPWLPPPPLLNTCTRTPYLAADALDDKRSLDRALQERLVLLTKRKSDQQWVVPQVWSAVFHILVPSMWCTHRHLTNH